MTNFLVYIERDEEDLVSVVEVMTYAIDGNEIRDDTATEACEGLNTCFNTNYTEDAGFLINKIETNLRAAKFVVGDIQLEEI